MEQNYCFNLQKQEDLIQYQIDSEINLEQIDKIIKHLPLPFCDNPEHEDQKISKICVNQNCQNVYSLLCPDCVMYDQKQNHNHANQYLSINHFIKHIYKCNKFIQEDFPENQIQQQLKQKSVQDFNFQQKKSYHENLEQNKQIEDKLKQLQKDVRRMKDLFDSFDRHLDDVIGDFNQECNNIPQIINKIIGNLIKESNNFEKLREQMQELFKYVKISDKIENIIQIDQPQQEEKKENLDLSVQDGGDNQYNQFINENYQNLEQKKKSNNDQDLCFKQLQFLNKKIEFKCENTHIKCYTEDLEKELQSIWEKINLTSVQYIPPSYKDIEARQPLKFIRSNFEDSQLIKIDNSKNEYILSEKGRGYVYSDKAFSRNLNNNENNIFSFKIKIKQIQNQGNFYVGLIKSSQLHHDPWWPVPNWSLCSSNGSNMNILQDTNDLCSFRNVKQFPLILKITLDLQEQEFTIEAEGQGFKVGLSPDGKKYVAQALKNNGSIRLTLLWSSSSSQLVEIM